jgi:hypothetical protein
MKIAVLSKENALRIALRIALRNVFSTYTKKHAEMI